MMGLVTDKYLHPPTPMKLIFLGAALALLSTTGTFMNQALAQAPAKYRTGGFAAAVHAYTFHRFTAFEAIEKTAQSGARCIDLRPNQKLSPDDETIVGPGMGEEKTRKLRDKLAQHDLFLLGFGVISIPSEEAKARPIFEWAKSLGVKVFNTESIGSLDTMEKLAKEFDINIGIHNHPRKKDDESYKIWDPKYVLSLIEKRDKRVGACADVGHWVRSGIRPVEALKVLEGRIVSSHFKDLHEFSGGGHDVPWGTGASEVPAMLDELKRQNFEGPLSVEYERNWLTSLPEVAQCIAFVRGYGTAKGYK
jgi:sugar phosphate isomerase/epimerase